MKLSTPRWWYTRDAKVGAVARLALTPISWIWAAATARRIANGRPVDPGVPVICVGNLTVGGAGKTPVARELARRLGGTVLTRGYGGSLAGPVKVDLAQHTAADVGDEPLMLAQDLDVWVSRDRAAGAMAAAQAGAKLVVMDDGHQNPAVARTLSLVVVDGETRNDEWPFGDGRVFPAGPMREPLKAGLARADAVVLLLPADLDAPDPALVRQFEGLPVLVARLAPAAPPPAGPQVGFAGVG
ncbi:MAG: tetraacyldisaccharide 4'-kinase, partial [Phenylobacterium sp.]|nr:tetraacyldisaccharide 4'-kinase [Phenylobacterium sp.]